MATKLMAVAEFEEACKHAHRQDLLMTALVPIKELLERELIERKKKEGV
jgi:hypothetical protein